MSPQVLAALIAAGGVVVAAIVSGIVAVLARRDDRKAMLTDIEILRQLQPGDPAYVDLETVIRRRASKWTRQPLLSPVFHYNITAALAVAFFVLASLLNPGGIDGFLSEMSGLRELARHWFLGSAIGFAIAALVIFMIVFVRTIRDLVRGIRDIATILYLKADTMRSRLRYYRSKRYGDLMEARARELESLLAEIKPRMEEMSRLSPEQITPAIKEEAKGYEERLAAIQTKVSKARRTRRRRLTPPAPRKPSAPRSTKDDPRPPRGRLGR